MENNSMKGKVYKRVLHGSPPPPERLFRMPDDVWMTSPPGPAPSTYFDSPAFFVAGLVGLCVLILVLCALICGMAYRLYSHRRKERAYECRRARNPVYRPVVQTLVHAKQQYTAGHKPTSLTVQTEVSGKLFSHQPLNNLNKCQRVSTPKLMRQVANLPAPLHTGGHMNITTSPFHSHNQQALRDFGSQNLSPLQAEVQFKYYHKLEAAAPRGITTNKGRKGEAPISKCEVNKASLYTLTFNLDSDSE